MVARIITGAHYGLKDWLVQRITALIMAVYAVLFTAAVGPAATLAGIARVANWSVAVLGVGMFTALTVRFARNLARLARVEPQVRP